MKKPTAKSKSAPSEQAYEDLHSEIIGGTKDAASARLERNLIIEDDLPYSKHLLLFIVVGIVFVFLAWASWADLEEVTHGQGRVIPSQEVQVLQHQEGGIIDEFLVKEGDIVKKDQIMIRLREVGAQSEFATSETRWLGLQAKIARLEAEAAGSAVPNFPAEVMEKSPQSVQEELNALRANQLNMSSQISVLQSQLLQRQQEITEITGRISDLSRVLSLSQDELDMIKPLVERGAAPKRDLIGLERQLAQQQTDLNSARQSLPRSRSAVTEIQNRITEVKNDVKARAQSELAQTTLEMQTIGKSLGALQDRKTRTDIRSPVDGIVKDIRINTVGGVVKPGDAVAEVVPTDDRLLIEAQVRPSDIAFIRPDQQATVKFTAYDFSIYGGLKGRVVDISADTIVDEKGNAFYRVKVQTDQTKLVHAHKELPIIPGMVASIDILTGHKTVMAYILKPFLKTMDSAMTER